jgi:hypothetical protein
LLCNESVVAKSEEMNLAESSEEGYGTRRAVLPVMMMMMMWRLSVRRSGG